MNNYVIVAFEDRGYLIYDSTFFAASHDEPMTEAQAKELSPYPALRIMPNN